MCQRGDRRGDGVATPLHAIAATLADERGPNAIDAIDAQARKHLQKAAELLLNGEGNAHAHEKEIERWDRVIQSHPEQIEEAEAARTQWLAAHADDRAEARRCLLYTSPSPRD